MNYVAVLTLIIFSVNYKVQISVFSGSRVAISCLYDKRKSKIWRRFATHHHFHTYCKENHVRVNSAKTKVCAFHLKPECHHIYLIMKRPTIRTLSIFCLSQGHPRPIFDVRRAYKRNETKNHNSQLHRLKLTSLICAAFTHVL